MHKTEMILDTDIFGDADDFFALLYALSFEQLKIELIVTTDEHEGARARQLQVLLRALGEDIPVAAGTDLGNTRLLFVDDHNEEVDFDFVERIREVVERNEKTFFGCMGPQSNLKAFCDKYPELTSKLEVVSMACALEHDENRVEHNVRYDVAGAQNTLKTFGGTWVLADQTRDKSLQFKRGTDFYNKICEIDTEAARMLLANAHAFFDNLYPESNYHDPLTISSLVADFVKFEDKKVVVCDDGRMFEDGDGHKARLSVGVDYDRFLEDFESRVLGVLKGKK